MIANIYATMGPSEWISLTLGVAAVCGTIWSNITAQKALRLSGQHRVAEFRKEWLEDLRKDVADFLTFDQTLSSLVLEIDDIKSAILKSNGTLKPMLEQQAVELIRQKGREHSARAAASAKILLRLNDNRELNGEMLDALSNVLKAADKDQSSNARALLVSSSRKLFKNEWDKLSTEMKT